MPRALNSASLILLPDVLAGDSKMEPTVFCTKRRHPVVVLVPEHPAVSDDESSSDCDDYQGLIPPMEYHSESDDFELLDDDQDQDTDPEPPPKKMKKSKTSLKKVCITQAEEACNFDHISSTWKKQDIESLHVPDAKFEPPDEIKTPLQYFKMLFTDEMIEHITHHTNLYSAQKSGDPIKTTAQEIECFLAILLYMGVFSFPSITDYWHQLSRYNLVADIMISKRFRQLRRLVHFNDNLKCHSSQDRFFKIRPLFEMLRKQCLLIPSTYRQSVDEVMVAYRGTGAGNLRQYFATKPGKWGFKIFCRASSCGIVHDLLLYQGKSTFFNVDMSEEEQTLPLGDKVMTLLCKTITVPRLSVVFCNNYFTSFGLFQRLNSILGIRCIGTVRPNRIGGVPLMSDKELVKKGRGACDYRSSDGIIAVKWVDNKCVNLLSNACGVKPFSTLTRWNKEAHVKVPCPSLLQAYNEHMGGVELSDTLVDLYKTPVRSRQCFFPLFGYMLDLAVSNSWLLYKRECQLANEKPMPLKDFRLSIASGLKLVNKPRIGRPPCSSLPATPTKRYKSRTSHPTTDVRYDNMAHWPQHSKNRGRCIFCPKGVSRWKCHKCAVFLCLNANQNCFFRYHKKKD